MNDAMRRLGGLVGEWDATMTHAWFLESLDTEVHGTATFAWLADAFLVMTSRWADDWKPSSTRGSTAPGPQRGVGDPGERRESTQEFVFGRSDARDAYVVFSHDDRGVYRVFDMTFEDGEWTMQRKDPDFHQRIVMRIGKNRIDMRADASEDAGRTWRKDLDFIFERRRDHGSA